MNGGRWREGELSVGVTGQNWYTRGFDEMTIASSVVSQNLGSVCGNEENRKRSAQGRTKKATHACSDSSSQEVVSWLALALRAVNRQSLGQQDVNVAVRSGDGGPRICLDRRPIVAVSWCCAHASVSCAATYMPGVFAAGRNSDATRVAAIECHVHQLTAAGATTQVLAASRMTQRTSTCALTTLARRANRHRISRASIGEQQRWPK